MKLNKIIIISVISMLFECEAFGSEEIIQQTQSFLIRASENPAFAEGQSIDLPFYIDDIVVGDGADGTRQAIITYGSKKVGRNIVSSPVDIRCVTTITEARNLVPGEEVRVRGIIGLVRYTTERTRFSYYDEMHLFITNCNHGN